MPVVPPKGDPGVIFVRMRRHPNKGCPIFRHVFLLSAGQDDEIAFPTIIPIAVAVQDLVLRVDADAQDEFLSSHLLSVPLLTLGGKVLRAGTIVQKPGRARASLGISSLSTKNSWMPYCLLVISKSA